MSVCVKIKWYIVVTERSTLFAVNGILSFKTPLKREKEFVRDTIRFLIEDMRLFGGPLMFCVGMVHTDTDF